MLSLLQPALSRRTGMSMPHGNNGTKRSMHFEMKRQTVSQESYRDILPNRWKRTCRGNYPAIILLLWQPVDAILPHVKFFQYSRLILC